MTPERLRELIAPGESPAVEFKGEEARRLSDTEVVDAEVLHLSAATYRRLGKRAAYVRQRGFEPLEQEQMVLQYVAKHGRITRREVAGLRQLSPDQPKPVLARLVKQGYLVAYGQKKGCFYTLSPKNMGESIIDKGAPISQPKTPKPGASR